VNHFHSQTIIEGSVPTFGGTKNQCFNLNMSDKDVADLAFLELSPHLKEKLASHIFSDVIQVM
jgi:hypothetical protein